MKSCNEVSHQTEQALEGKVKAIIARHEAIYGLKYNRIVNSKPDSLADKEGFLPRNNDDLYSLPFLPNNKGRCRTNLPVDIFED